MTGSELYPIVTSALPKMDSAEGGVLSDVWHGLIGDKVANWRLLRAADASEALGKELDRRGTSVNIDKIPERFAYSWFDKVTQEDEPEILELFAKLLANASEGNEDALDRKNIELVSQMSPKDAELFGKLSEASRELSKSGASRTTLPRRSTIASEEIKWDYVSLVGALEQEGFLDIASIDRLVSIGVLRDAVIIDFDNDRISKALGRGLGGERRSFPNLNYATNTKRVVQMTRVGDSLLEALFPVSAP